MSPWWRLLIYLVAAPLIGGLLAGIDRRISARMQARLGPPLLQPFYDVAKLWCKEPLVVRRSQNFYILFFGHLLYCGFFCGSSRHWLFDNLCYNSRSDCFSSFSNSEFTFFLQSYWHD